MKLRHVVLLLLLANLAYAGWSHGLLLGLGWGPAVQDDPGFVAQQVAPDAVRIEAYSPAMGKAAEPAAAPAPDGNRASAAPPPAPEPKTDAPAHDASAMPNPAATPPAPAASETP
jgi:hypothetical protein